MDFPLETCLGRLSSDLFPASSWWLLCILVAIYGPLQASKDIKVPPTWPLNLPLCNEICFRSSIRYVHGRHSISRYREHRRSPVPHPMKSENEVLKDISLRRSTANIKESAMLLVYIANTNSTRRYWHTPSYSTHMRNMRDTAWLIKYGTSSPIERSVPGSFSDRVLVS